MEAKELDTPTQIPAESQSELLYHTRSEEVQEIIGRMPSWIIRRGIMVIALLVAAAFAGAAFIRYPETVGCQVTITAIEPPSVVFAAGDARVQELLVKDGEQVDRGSPLMVMNNSLGGYSAMLEAKRAALAIDTCPDIHKAIKQLPAARPAFSGKLQRAYAELMIDARLCSADRAGNKDYKRQQELRLSARKLLDLCESWEQQYLLLSTEAGQVRFFKPLQAHAGLKAGEAVLAIVRSADAGFIATGNIPAAAYPEVKVGQTVLMNPEGYSFQKFGMLKGKINALSSVPVNGLYPVTIVLDNGLKTTTGHEIPCAGFNAKGDIILQDKSVLQQLLENTAR